MHIDDRRLLDGRLCERPIGENDARGESEKETDHSHLSTSAMGSAAAFKSHATRIARPERPLHQPPIHPGCLPAKWILPADCATCGNSELIGPVCHKRLAPCAHASSSQHCVTPPERIRQGGQKRGDDRASRTHLFTPALAGSYALPRLHCTNTALALR